MKHLNGQADVNHIEHYRRLYGDAVAVRPCPWNGTEFSPYTTLFAKADGTFGFVTAIKPVYYMHRDRTFRPLSEVTSHHGNRKITLNEKWGQIHPEYLFWLSERQKRIGGQLNIPSGNAFAYSTQSINGWLKRNVPIGLTAFGPVYPSGGSNDPVDGRCWRGPVDQTFANIRSGNGSSGEDTQDDTGYQPAFIRGSATANQYSYLMRGIFIFDTSSIPAGATVNDATYSWKCHSKGNSNGSPDLHAFFATTAANNTIAASDFQSNGSVSSLGSNSYASVTANTTPASASYNDIALSSVASVNMGTGARTKIGVGLSWDVTNNTTGLGYSAGNDSYFAFFFSESAGTGSDPKLAGNYTAGGSTFTPRHAILI